MLFDTKNQWKKRRDPTIKIKKPDIKDASKLKILVITQSWRS